jgi:hypothetical protein
MAKLKGFVRGEINRRRDEFGLLAQVTSDRVTYTEGDFGPSGDYEADCILSTVLQQGGDQKMSEEEFENELIGLLL